MLNLIQLEKKYRSEKKILVNINEIIEENFNYEKYRNKEIVLLNGDSDFPPWKKEFFPDKGLDKNYEERTNYDVIKKIEEFNINVTCFNTTVISKNINRIFLGPTWKVPLPSVVNNKDILCYANFGIPTVDCYHGRERKKLLDLLKNLDFVTVENCVLDTPRRKTEDKYHDYFQKLSRSKYCICPRGCGIDCYRIFDAIHFGCIPIVKNYGDYKHYFKNFNILFVEDWSELQKDLLI